MIFISLALECEDAKSESFCEKHRGKPSCQFGMIKRKCKKTCKICGTERVIFVLYSEIRLVIVMIDIRHQ